MTVAAGFDYDDTEAWQQEADAGVQPPAQPDVGSDWEASDEPLADGAGGEQSIRGAAERAQRRQEGKGRLLSPRKAHREVSATPRSNQHQRTSRDGAVSDVNSAGSGSSAGGGASRAAAGGSGGSRSVRGAAAESGGGGASAAAPSQGGTPPALGGGGVESNIQERAGSSASSASGSSGQRPRPSKTERRRNANAPRRRSLFSESGRPGYSGAAAQRPSE